MCGVFLIRAHVFSMLRWALDQLVCLVRHVAITQSSAQVANTLLLSCGSGTRGYCVPGSPPHSSSLIHEVVERAMARGVAEAQDGILSSTYMARPGNDQHLYRQGQDTDVMRDVHGNSWRAWYVVFEQFKIKSSSVCHNKVELIWTISRCQKST